ncbi:MAG: dTDP-4-dehydrorhamnose reductase [Bryobacteraceae bacterium]|nr:dTDP-4-dehydrorhamnose reductase [Bryobacteraceae bacterium]
MHRILILGARGTLGQQLARLYPDAACWDREEIDVLDFPGFEAAVRGLPGPVEAVINCVAFNDVDGAEDRPEAAHALNAEFPGRLAALCGELAIPLVHYSTNYVFDGAQGEYAESDPPSPLSVYARSKAEGERAVCSAAAKHYLVRTAVIFGHKGASDLSKRSFVDIMLDLAKKSSVIRAVDDEINSVTYASDLAAATKQLLGSKAPYGVYHLSNAGSASWCDMAREIFRITGQDHIEVQPVPSTAFPRKARRPRKAVLLNTKAPPLRPWQEALAGFLRSTAGV